MKAPAALPFYLYDFGAIRPDSFLQGDSFKLLEGVQTETVDMVFIDPPYFIKKAEWDTFGNQQEYNDFMARAFWEAERILKPNGTLAFWHNDLQQVARLLCWLENWTQFVFNSWAVWVKPNFRKKLWANPGTGNTLRSWFNITEFCIVLVKGEPGTAWNKSGLALAMLSGHKFAYPIYYDVEYEKYNLNCGKAQNTAIIKAALETLEAGGYYAAVYCSRDFFINQTNLSGLANFDKWEAAYTKTDTATVQNGLWQYSSKNALGIAGFGNSLDCDVCYRDYPAIMEKNGLNGYTKTAQAAQPKATEYMVTAGPMSAGDKNTIKAQAEALGLPVTVKEC